RTSRGSTVPNFAKTYWTKPLQSKPEGSLPPFRYGTPRNSRAVFTTAGTRAGTRAGTAPGGPGAVSPAPGGSAAPGNGRGTGGPALRAAQAPVNTASTTTARGRSLRITTVISV